MGKFRPLESSDSLIRESWIKPAVNIDEVLKRRGAIARGLLEAQGYKMSDALGGYAADELMGIEPLDEERRAYDVLQGILEGDEIEGYGEMTVRLTLLTRAATSMTQLIQLKQGEQ